MIAISPVPKDGETIDACVGSTDAPPLIPGANHVNERRCYAICLYSSRTTGDMIQLSYKGQTRDANRAW